MRTFLHVGANALVHDQMSRSRSHVNARWKWILSFLSHECPQTSWHVVHIPVKSDDFYLNTTVTERFVFLPVSQLYLFTAAPSVFRLPVAVKTSGDISAWPLTPPINPFSCSLKDTLNVMLSAVLSYSSLKLLIHAYKETRPT